MLLIFKEKDFDFFHIQGLHIVASTLSDFCWSIPEVRIADYSFSFPGLSEWLHQSGITYCIVTRAINFLPNSRHPVELRTFQIWLKWTSLIIREFEKVETWPSQFLRRKSRLCSLGIIDNTMLFIVQSKSFRFLPYPRTKGLCRHPVRFSLFGSRGLERRLLILLTLVFIDIHFEHSKLTIEFEW
jgi:hypothetical protein